MCVWQYVRVWRNCYACSLLIQLWVLLWRIPSNSKVCLTELSAALLVKCECFKPLVKCQCFNPCKEFSNGNHSYIASVVCRQLNDYFTDCFPCFRQACGQLLHGCAAVWLGTSRRVQRWNCKLGVTGYMLLHCGTGLGRGAWLLRALS